MMCLQLQDGMIVRALKCTHADEFGGKLQVARCLDC